MRMRAGLRVSRVGFSGTGQVTRFRDGLCEVLWQRGHTRERHPEAELIWCGLTVHTTDGRPGKVVKLGYNKVRVRLADGGCHWMTAVEFAPRESNQKEMNNEQF